VLAPTHVFPRDPQRPFFKFFRRRPLRFLTILRVVADVVFHFRLQTCPQKLNLFHRIGFWPRRCTTLVRVFFRRVRGVILFSGTLVPLPMFANLFAKKSASTHEPLFLPMAYWGGFSFLLLGGGCFFWRVPLFVGAPVALSCKQFFPRRQPPFASPNSRIFQTTDLSLTMQLFTPHLPLFFPPS